jgi:protein-S-isoprenylcysteine O-methyltransferase Ste14
LFFLAIVSGKDSEGNIAGTINGRGTADGTRRFAADGTNVPPTLPTTALVVDGIYRRTRNPLYLGLTLIYLGLGVAAGSLWAIGLVVPLLWVINVGVVKREERYLELKFGDD